MELIKGMNLKDNGSGKKYFSEINEAHQHQIFKYNDKFNFLFYFILNV